MFKYKGLSWIALKNQKILAVKVQYSYCSKFDDFRHGLKKDVGRVSCLYGMGVSCERKIKTNVLDCNMAQLKM
jgi:hypothetical protein